MPIHEFICGCGHEEEKIVPIGTKTIKCPGCGSDMNKIMSLSTFHLKGGGWASTGYSNYKGEVNEKRLAS